MTTALILNIVLAALVVVGIVGMLARSIVSQEHDARIGPVLGSRRRRRATARTRFVGRTVENRA